MKIRLQKEIGSMLVVTLVTTGVMGVALASYLGLVRSQNQSVMRSLQWNQALPIAEAGVEEALVHLSNVGTNSRVANGWIGTGNTVVKVRYIGANIFITTITSNTSPIITSWGYTPYQQGYYNYTRRGIQVATTNDAIFAKGLVAKGLIDLRGNNIRTDSFDSTDSTKSTGGRYDASKSRDKGDVATNSGLINSLSVGNAEIYGHASTGPGGSVSVGSNGGVGSKAWLDAGNHGIQPGYTSDDMNVAFPDVLPPFSGGASTPTSGTVSGTSYNYVLGSGNYEMSSLSMSGNQKMIITNNAVLFVRGNISISGNAQILIASGASLKLYVEGASASIGGNGVMNTDARALDFSYYGLPTNTSVTMSGNAAFTGTIYAPNAALSMGGGGSTTYDFVGASISGTVTMNGHYNFHYDESLGNIGPRRGYIVTSWNEI